MEETVRLNKFLSEKGICSRREADRLVDEGKVMVNGVCAVMGQKVSSADEIVVDGKKVSTKQVKPVLIAVNKPAGIVCTTARFEGEKNIVDMVKYPTRIYPIGRLDHDICQVKIKQPLLSTDLTLPSLMNFPYPPEESQFRLFHLSPAYFYGLAMRLNIDYEQSETNIL